MKDKACVYIMYNKDNECLYVGITNNMDIRINQHVHDKEWIKEVSNIRISEYINRNVARIYEIYYISTMNPKYNIEFSGDVRGFNLNIINDLEFKEYVIKDTDIVKLVIEEFRNMNKDNNSVTMKYSNIERLVNNVSMSANNKILNNKEVCKIFSKCINILESESMLMCEGSGFSSYIPYYLHDILGESQYNNEDEYLMLETHLSKISIDYDRKDFIKLNITFNSRFKDYKID